MAVGFDAVGPTSAGQTGTASPLAWSHTSVAASTALLIGLGYGHTTGTDGVVAVTVGGSAAVLLGTVDNDNSTAGLTALYGFAGLSSGAHAISVAITGGAAGLELEGGSVSYAGADPVAPFGSAVTAFGNSTAPAVTVAGTAASSLVGGVASIGTSVLTNPATSRWTANFGNSTGAGNAGQADRAGGGSVTLTWSGTSLDFWGAVAVEIRAAGGAPAPAPAAARRTARRFRSRHIRAWTPNVALPGPSGPVAVSDAETASVTDGAETADAALADAETAAFSEGSPFVSLASAETASATETQASTAALSSTEAASAADTAGTLVTTSAETASATEAQGTSAALSSAESASAAETQALGIPVSETASASDSASPPPATLAAAEAASAADAASSVAVASADSFSAAESASALVPVASSEVASATDAASPPPATLASAESASASEGPVVVRLAAFDAGAAAEAQALIASLSGTDSASMAETGTLALASADAASAAETQGTAAALSSAETASTTETGSVGNQAVSDAETASFTEGTPAIALASAEVVTGTDGGEGGTGGTQVHDTDSWHAEDSGFSFVSDAETVTATDAPGVIKVALSDSFSAAEVSTSFWRADTERVTATDALATLTGPAVSSSDSFAMSEGVGPFRFSDTDSFSAADHPTPGDVAAYLDVWSGAAPFRWTGGGFMVHAPSGRMVVLVDRIDPGVLALAARVAAASEVVFLHDSEECHAVESYELADATVTMTLAPALVVTCALSKC